MKLGEGPHFSHNARNGAPDFQGGRLYLNDFTAEASSSFTSKTV
jgi:hypothetical protein